MKKLALSILLWTSLTTAGLAQPRQLQAPDTDDRPKIHVDVYNVMVTLNPEEHRLVGVAEITFTQLDRQTFAVFDLDRRLRISNATIGGKPVSFRQFDLDSTVEFDMSGLQFASQAPVLHVEYSGI